MSLSSHHHVGMQDDDASLVSCVCWSSGSKKERMFLFAKRCDGMSLFPYHFMIFSSLALFYDKW